MTSIDRIMYLIDWNRSESEQREGIAIAREVSCIKAFFQPVGLGYSKSVWDNCAVIICERSDAELTPYILDMLLWLEDLNWPGAELIQQRLIQFRDVSRLAMSIDNMVPALEKLKKESWLISISYLLESTVLKNVLKVDTIQILSKYSSH